MSVAVAVALPRERRLPPPRRASAAPSLEDPRGGNAFVGTAWRVPPRVYSPYGRRRLARPMATPLRAAERGLTGPPGRPRWRRLRGRRG